MSFRKMLVLSPVGVAIAAFVLAPAASAATSCTGTQSTNVSGDLVVPSGKTCTINPGVAISGNVIVNGGATLIDNGAFIGHDVQATSPKGIGIGGSPGNPGTIGHDIQVTGIMGSASSGNNYICNNQIGNNIVVTGSTSKAGQWIIGDTDESCSRGGNQVGNDLQVTNNNDRVDVSDNKRNVPPTGIVGIFHNLQVMNNAVTKTSPVVEGNYIGNTAQCQAGTKTDSDFSTSGHNIVGGTNQGCP
jgi:hypothetical protein